MKYFSDFINIVFPKYCLNCHSRLRKTEIVLCTNCADSLKFIEQKVCPKCGSFLFEKTSHNCDFAFDAARSVFQFDETLRNLIHHFKYEEMKKLGEFLGKYAADFLEKEHFAAADIIAPVPLHKVKKRARGFNQSEILTRHIAKIIDCEHIPELIQRKKFTQTQTKLSRQQREKNVKDAFNVNAKYEVTNRKILLVDDVFTTGSTVNSISKVLKEAGASKIFVLTIARA